MSFNITTTAGQLARTYAEREKRWDASLQRALRKIIALVDRGQVKNLTGGGSAAAGAYPVPIRTGFLRRSGGSRVEPRAGMVFNTAEYANAIHNGGVHPYGNPNAQVIAARPFLQDAADRVDHLAIMADAAREALA